jgi:archaellum component FlaC
MKQAAAVGAVVLAILSVILTLVVTTWGRAADAEGKAIAAQRTADGNTIRVEGVGEDIQRIEQHMDKLGDQFEKIDTKFEKTGQDIQTIMLCMPRPPQDP